MKVLVSIGKSLRRFFSCATAALSLVCAPFRSGRITFSEFLEELQTLGLKGERFGPELYRRALEQHLGVRIEVVIIDDAEDPASRRAFAEAGNTALLWYRPAANLAQIFVLASLSPLEMSASIFHELSHLAAGHRLRTSEPFVSGVLEGRAHHRRLRERRSPMRTTACEMEARVREDYCMLAGALGAACLEDDDLRQVR
jgi:hypothetical protein